MDSKNGLELINSQRFKSLIHIFRGNYVMLDADLAAIYGYSTKNFNRQVKNNIERFDDSDLMFQLSAEEMLNLFNCEEFALKEEFLRCKNSTSSSNENKTIHKTDNWGGRRYLPYAFTEQGVYMLMTVLKGPLAVKTCS